MEQFGQYRLEELIGRGGMGEVYRAVDTARNDRVVALKRMPAHLASDEEFRARFRKEAETASKLTEPHIVPIHDFGEIDGRLYLDMRLVSGRDLATVLEQQGALAPARAVSIVAQVASALDDAHRAGLLHRDVKPANILLTGAALDFAYLADFGIARAVDGSSASVMTATGATVGTVDYMAPERFLGTPTDHRADVYALACVLHQALTGHKPFPGNGAPALMHSHLSVDPPKPSRQQPGVPAALDAVVARGMAKRPEDRYHSAGALAVAAEAAVHGRSVAETMLPPRAPGWPPSSPPSLPQQRAASQPVPIAAGGWGRPQSGPVPGANLHTVVPMQGGGFTGPPTPPPSGPAGWPAPAPAPGPPARPKWPFVVAAAVTVLAIGIGSVIALNGPTGPGGNPPVTSTPPDSSTPPVSSSTPPPQLTPNDQLTASIVDSGVRLSTCVAEPISSDGVLAEQICETTEPEVGVVDFQLFDGAASYRSSLDDAAFAVDLPERACAVEGGNVGTNGSYDIVCGYLTLDDGTVVYVIVWGRQSSLVQGLVGGEDPEAVYDWWYNNDPIRA